MKMKQFLFQNVTYWEKLLAIPAASNMSEMMFSAAGGVDNVRTEEM